MACRLTGAKPLSEPMLGPLLLDPQEHTSVKFQSKFMNIRSRKCTWKCLLESSGHFVSTSICWICQKEPTMIRPQQTKNRKTVCLCLGHYTVPTRPMNGPCIIVITEFCHSTIEYGDLMIRRPTKQYAYFTGFSLYPIWCLTWTRFIHDDLMIRQRPMHNTHRWILSQKARDADIMCPFMLAEANC